MPTDKELILVGLYDFKKRLAIKIDNDIEAYQKGRMSLSDLVKYLKTSDTEMTKTINSINEISPPLANDDIPF